MGDKVDASQARLQKLISARMTNPTEKSVILIAHDPEEKDDRASAWLSGQGYRLNWCCPAAGQPIPALDSSVAGAVVYGGKYDVDQAHADTFLTDELRFIEAALERETPLLGICLGGQLLAHVLGEKVGPHHQGHAEYGYYELELTEAGEGELGAMPKVLQSHWHGWHRTPDCAVKLAGSSLYSEQAFRYGHSAYALQFHPEASRTTLTRWIGRRPSERHSLPGAFPPDRQLADNLRYDRPLGDWFHNFLGRWMKPGQLFEAAE